MQQKMRLSFITKEYAHGALFYKLHSLVRRRGCGVLAANMGLGGEGGGVRWSGNKRMIKNQVTSGYLRSSEIRKFSISNFLIFPSSNAYAWSLHLTYSPN